MSDKQNLQSEEVTRLTALLAGLGYGLIGAFMGFTAGSIIATVLVRNSSIGIAGGGDGVEVLVVMYVFAEVCGAVVGGVAGFWLGWRFVGRGP